MGFDNGYWCWFVEQSQAQGARNFMILMGASVVGYLLFSNVLGFGMEDEEEEEFEDEDEADGYYEGGGYHP